MEGKWTKIIVPSSTNSELPLLIEPFGHGISIIDALPEIRVVVAEMLHLVGAVIFRGFHINSLEQFHQFAAGFGYSLLPYDFGSTPRSHVADGIYTSTEYPQSHHIPLHNEQSYTREWAMKLWFYCVTPSLSGGSTPLADSRNIYSKLDPSLRDHFISKGLMYVRNYGNGLDVPWQKVFNTKDRGTVKSFCEQKGIVCEWKEDGELRTRQICQVVERHPTTGATVWFNQAHLFHISSLDPKLRAMLLSIVDTADLPRNVYYADGREIEDDKLNEIRRVINECTIHFSWKKNDILLIDNMLIAHGRTPFIGDRKVLVAMAEPHSNYASV